MMRTIGGFVLMIFVAEVLSYSSEDEPMRKMDGIAQILNSSKERDNIENTERFAEKNDRRVSTELAEGIRRQKISEIIEKYQKIFDPQSRSGEDKMAETTIDSLDNFLSTTIMDSDLVETTTEQVSSETCPNIITTTLLSRNEEEMEETNTSSTLSTSAATSTEGNIISTNFPTTQSTLTELPATESLDTVTPSQSTSSEILTATELDTSYPTESTNFEEESTEVTDKSGTTQSTSTEKSTTRRPEATSTAASSSGTSKDKEGSEKQSSTATESSSEETHVSSTTSNFTTVAGSSSGTGTTAGEEPSKVPDESTPTTLVCDCKTTDWVTDSSETSTAPGETTIFPTEDTSSGEETTSAEVTATFPASDETKTTADDDDVTEISDTDESTTVETSEATNLPPSSSHSPITNSTDVTETTAGNGENHVKQFDYLVLDKNTGVYCTLSKMNISIRIMRYRRDGTMVPKNYKVPRTANVRGTCGEKDSSMTLSWAEPETKEAISDISSKTNSVTFFLVNDGRTFYVDFITIEVYVNWLGSINNGGILSVNSTRSLRLFEATLKSGIHTCETKTIVYFGEIELSIAGVSLIAFNDKNDLSSRSEESCLAPKTSANRWLVVVGIFAGVVALGFVVFVVWRMRRNRTRRIEVP